ncbi:transcriptional regulator, partial [Salmonella enterica]|nr:transcriptional regulator [Salmonella enterica]
GDESEGERAEPKPRVLDEKEETLLSLFNQLPEAEKLRVILHTKAVLQEMDLLKNNVFDLINDLKK